MKTLKSGIVVSSDHYWQLLEWVDTHYSDYKVFLEYHGKMQDWHESLNTISEDLYNKLLKYAKIT